MYNTFFIYETIKSTSEPFKTSFIYNDRSMLHRIQHEKITHFESIKQSSLITPIGARKVTQKQEDKSSKEISDHKNVPEVIKKNCCN